MSNLHPSDDSPTEEQISETPDVPFFTQSAVLKRYAHQSDPKSDSVALAVILDVLRQHPELRQHFFSLRPHAAWIPVLWANQFFHTLPAPEVAPQGHQYFPSWDVQWFLIANANEMPDYVLRHIELLDSIAAPPAYRGASLRAVQALLPQNADWVHRALPTIQKWMEDATTAYGLVYDASDLIDTLAEHGDRAAFALLNAICQPLPNPNAKSIGEDSGIINGEAVSLLDTTGRFRLTESEEGLKMLTRLRQLDFSALADLWENLLLKSLAVEAATRGYDDEQVGDSTWWRIAVENTNQDSGFDYKDFLLENLRDTLEAEGREDANEIKAHLDRYLSHPRQILRRLGLHLLRTFPQPFIPLVEQYLFDTSHYEDSGIHHEFFGLLADGFPVLNEQSRKSVLKIIMDGPSAERLDDMVEMGLSMKRGDAAQMRQLYQEIWHRDRLWVIREHLPQTERAYLDEITARLSEPEHPAFSTYSTGAFFVSNVSPRSREELSALPPEQLLEFLETWQEPSRVSVDPEEINWEGLASEIGNLVGDDLARYADWIGPMAKLRPRLAMALVNIALAVEKSVEPKAPARRGTFRGVSPRSRRRTRVVKTATQEVDLSQEEQENEVSVPVAEEPENTEAQLATSKTARTELSNREVWELRLNVVEAITSDSDLRTDIVPNFDARWSHVRRELVSLLQSGLKASDGHRVPDELLPRVCDALLIFADDPDPTPSEDRPAEGWMGHNDPLQVSINHVRPQALSALIDYAACRAQRGLDGHPVIGVGPARLEQRIADKLVQRLNREQESSWAVHSIFGRRVCNLYWIDKSWVEAHLNDIFPSAHDETNLRYFAAAWDSYVVSNRLLYSPLFERMRPLYVRAIEAMAQGYVTSTYLERTKAFASHLFFDYFYAPYDLRSPAGERNLLRLFFEKASPKERGEAAWVLWRTVGDKQPEGDENSDELEEAPNEAKLWQLTREFWQWRVDEASQQGHPSDFDEEMERLIVLIRFVPERETVASLFQLVSANLPHLGRDGSWISAWDDLEAFVASEVERDPFNSIRLFTKMHAQIQRPRWSRQPDTKFILETALASDEARTNALDLIDLMARQGAHDYDELYQKWSGLRL